MMRLTIVLLGLTSLISAKPAFLPVSLTYAAPLSLGTQAGTNSEPNSPEDVTAEKTGVTNGIAGTTVGSRLVPERQSSLVHALSSAPLGADGRVVDTPEVTAAKAAHAAAHINERINLANEAARSSDSSDLADGDVKNAISNGKIDLANEVARSDNARTVNNRVVPLVLGNGVVAALVPIDLNGNVPEVATRGDQNPDDVRSIDALAVAGPALAYGRLVY